jgi:hypothetical protein
LKKINQRKVLFFEGVGFLALTALSWLDEFLGLPSILFGDGTYQPRWSEAIMETVAIVAVSIPVFLLTKRLISRIFYLESFVTVCAWCKRINHEGEWLPLEGYLEKNFQAQTTHGMCPTCASQAEAGWKGHAGSLTERTARIA